MPLIELNTTITGSRMLLWKVEETEDELKNLLTSRNRTDLIPETPFRHPARNLEWLAARCALTSVFGEATILYDDQGKPHLEKQDGHLSISHAWPYVALFFHADLHTGTVIEWLDVRILRI